MLKTRLLFFFPTAQVSPAPPGAKIYHDMCMLGKLVSGWFMPADSRTTQPPHLGIAGSSWRSWVAEVIKGL